MYHYAIDTKYSILDDLASKVCCALFTLVIIEGFSLSFHSLFYKNNNIDFKQGGSGRHVNPDGATSDTWNEIDQEVSEWMAAWRNQHKCINKKTKTPFHQGHKANWKDGKWFNKKKKKKWTLFSATTQGASGGRVSASIQPKLLETRQMVKEFCYLEHLYVTHYYIRFQ